MPPTLLCNESSGYVTGHPVVHPDRGWASVWNEPSRDGGTKAVVSPGNVLSIFLGSKLLWLIIFMMMMSSFEHAH